MECLLSAFDTRWLERLLSEKTGGAGSAIHPIEIVLITNCSRNGEKKGGAYSHKHIKKAILSLY